MNNISSYTNWIKKYRWFLLGAIVVVGALVFWFSINSSGNNRITVKTGAVQESIQVVGNTKPQASVDLGFNSSGRIASSRVRVGDHVAQGQVLASLENGDLSADLEKAESVLQEENVRLAEISNNSPQTLSEARQKVVQAVKQAFSLSDNAVRNQADQFFQTPRDNPRFEVVVVDNNYIHYFPVDNNIVLDLNSRRALVETALNDWQSEILTVTPDNAQALAQKSLSHIDNVGSFLDRLAYAVNSFEYVDYAYAATVSGYKASVESARSDVSTARGNLVSALQALSSSPVSIDGSVSSISIQEAKVSQAQSEVDSVRASLSKGTIVAPFDGVITQAEAHPGEVASLGNPLISLISSNDLYIEADVSEIKIGKVNINNPVTITFDAFPGETFLGHVVFIEPGETLVDDVPHYKIRVELEHADSRLKSGLSANLKIQTAEKDDVVRIPGYALAKENGLYFANKIIAGKQVKTSVSVGLLGDDGNIEVTSGLQAGDVISY